jgi:dihydroorotase-like cyclic amidohydrolase
MAMLIRGGQVLGPRGTLEPADVLVEADRVAAVGSRLAAPAARPLPVNRYAAPVPVA